MNESDWRITNQETYLTGVTLIRRQWQGPAESDHDHCEFCWAKFGDTGDMLHEGWTTENGYHWICDGCFSEFRDRFRWQWRE